VIYHGIAYKFSVPLFHPRRYATVPIPNPADFSRSRCDTRPACRLRRHHPGEAGVGASFACVPGAEREKLSLLDLSREREKFI
jgi:hypothetical protein